MARRHDFHLHRIHHGSYASWQLSTAAGRLNTFSVHRALRVEWALMLLIIRHGHDMRRMVLIDKSIFFYLRYSAPQCLLQIEWLSDYGARYHTELLWNAFL